MGCQDTLFFCLVGVSNVGLVQVKNIFRVVYPGIQFQSYLVPLGLLNSGQRHSKTAGIVSAFLALFFFEEVGIQCTKATYLCLA